MRVYLSFILLFVSAHFYSQEVPNFEAIDSLYREDQFYFGTTYNIFSKKPTGVSQNSFSVGLSGGFLRDFPINKSRKIAIASGLGFSYNNYKQNLVISQVSNTINYRLIDADAVLNKNKLALLAIEVPLEFRWRTSTFESHKFWRIYSGVKAGYVLYNKSRYSANDGDYSVTNNPDINQFQYGVYTSAGYNTWNLYAYYGLSDFFKKEILSPNGNLRTLNIGLMFYIL